MNVSLIIGGDGCKVGKTWYDSFRKQTMAKLKINDGSVHNVHKFMSFAID